MVGQSPTGSHGCIHENENTCRVIANRDDTPLGESLVIFCYTYVSNGENPLKCRKTCETCGETLEIRYPQKDT